MHENACRRNKSIKYVSRYFVFALFFGYFGIAKAEASPVKSDYIF